MDWSWDGETPEAPARTYTPTQPSASAWSWDGEKYPGGWNSANTIIDEVLNLDYFTLRARSHQMFETNMYARGIVRRLVTNEVHTGLDLEADPTQLILGIPEEDLKDWSDRTEVFFNAWADTPSVCDFENRIDMTLGELSASARREALVGGDVLVVLRQHPVTKLPTIQLIGGHLVQTPLITDEEVTITQGVELDESGRHVAYHVQQTDAFESTRIPAFGDSSGRRVAWLMYGTDRRVGQVRGVPLLGIVLQSLKEIDRYRDSTQRKAVVNSILAMWVEKTQDKIGTLPLTGSAVKTGTASDTDTFGAPRSWNVVDQIPGVALEELQVGEKPHAFKSDGGDTVQFPDFEAAIVSAMAWCFEVPPEIIRLSFDKNYSASQASLNEFGLYLKVQRRRQAVSFNQPIYENWLTSSVRKGTIVAPGFLAASSDVAQFERYAAWVHADWIGAVKPVTDVLKMVKAYEIAEAHGWMTNSRISRELNGTRYSTNARIVRAERELLPLPGETEDTPNDDTTVDD
jgi:lambda family phage portal protein